MALVKYAIVIRIFLHACKISRRQRWRLNCQQCSEHSSRTKTNDKWTKKKNRAHNLYAKQMVQHCEHWVMPSSIFIRTNSWNCVHRSYCMGVLFYGLQNMPIFYCFKYSGIVDKMPLSSPMYTLHILYWTCTLYNVRYILYNGNEWSFNARVFDGSSRCSFLPI